MRKALTFGTVRVTIQTKKLPRCGGFTVSEEFFSTTVYPTTALGADGNSGDKSAKEQTVSGRKRPKASETAQKTFQPLFGSRMSSVRTRSPRLYRVFITQVSYRHSIFLPFAMYGAGFMSLLLLRLRRKCFWNFWNMFHRFVLPCICL